MAAFQQGHDVELVFHTTYDFLFGQSGQPVYVLGKKAALDELRKAVEADELIVRVDQPDHAGTAVDQSLELLRSRNAFPANDDLLRFTAQSPELQLVGGVTPEDWIVKDTVINAVYPPLQFTQLNVDFLLAFLRVAQTYHSQGRVYQLVILTQTHEAQYHIDILPTDRDAKPTHSVHLHRSFA